MNIVFLDLLKVRLTRLGLWASGVTHFAPHCSFPPSSMMLYALALSFSLSLSLVNGLSLLPPSVGAPLCDLPRPCFSLIFAVQMSRAICVIMYSHCIYLELPPNPCFFLKSELHLEDHKDSSALSIVLEMKRGSVETLKLPVIVNSLIFQVDTDQSHRKQKLMQEYPSP